MKASKDNLFTDMASGSSKNMTFFRRKSGKTVIGRRRGPDTTELSEDRRKVKDRFRRAIDYARNAMKSPETKALYQTAVGFDQSAYTIAVRDYYRKPVVDAIETVAYTGQAGEVIRILASDDFQVVAVKLTIRSAAGAVLENGDAVKHPNGVDWVYTTTAANEPLAGSTITAVAYDLPDNTGMLQITL